MKVGGSVNVDQARNGSQPSLVEGNCLLSLNVYFVRVLEYRYPWVSVCFRRKFWNFFVSSPRQSLVWLVATSNLNYTASKARQKIRVFLSRVRICFLLTTFLYRASFLYV
jgi:hypothetical protein